MKIRAMADAAAMNADARVSVVAADLVGAPALQLTVTRWAWISPVICPHTPAAVAAVALLSGMP